LISGRGKVFWQDEKKGKRGLGGAKKSRTKTYELVCTCTMRDFFSIFVEKSSEKEEGEDSITGKKWLNTASFHHS